MNPIGFHIDVFAGIGGMTLGFEQHGFKTILFCEQDKQRQKDLRHNWPEIPIVADVNDSAAISAILADSLRERFARDEEQHGQPEKSESENKKREHASGRSDKAHGKNVADAGGAGLQGRHDQRGSASEGAHGRHAGAGGGALRKTPIILSAGVPCQPASAAGDRKGALDDRWLWPQTLGLVGRIKPDFLLFENPLGIASLRESAAIPGVEIKRLRNVPGRTLSEILEGINALGYELPTDHDGAAWIPVVPVAGVGGFHGRDRLWIIARKKLDNADSGRREQCDSNIWTASEFSPRRKLPDWNDGRIQKGEDGTYRVIEPTIPLLAFGVPARSPKLRGFGNSVAPRVVEVFARLIKETIIAES